MKPKTNFKAIGYVRVSTNEQAREGISLDHQRDKIKSYCKLNDLDLIEIISDPGKSGKNLKRPGIKKLISELKGIDAVVVYKLDRLSRKVKDTLELIELFEGKNIAFHSFTEKIDTATAMGKFFLNITAAFSQMQRDYISEVTADGLRGKKEKGEKTGGAIPYGFNVVVVDDKKRLTQNPNEQKMVKLVRSLKGNGFTLPGICNELTKRKYEPKGKYWHPQTVKNILSLNVGI